MNVDEVVEAVGLIICLAALCGLAVWFALMID